MRYINAIGIAALIGAIVSAPASAAQDCPPLPNRLTPRIQASLSRDERTGVYTYGYAVANEPSSAQPMESLVIDALPGVANVAKPSGWSGRAVHWKPTRTRPGGDWVWWDALRTPRGRRTPGSSTLISPGAALGGFSFQSPKPPGVVRFHAVGYLPPASGDAPCASFGADEDQAEDCTERLHQRCPELDRPILEQAATGNTVGPVDALAVQMAIKGASTPAPVNPGSEGMLPVAILGSATLNVASIDASSVRLGIGQAAPRGAGHIEDVNRDGVPDLVLQFPTQGTGVQCGDVVMIVSGKTTAGLALAGFDAIRTVGCR